MLAFKAERRELLDDLLVKHKAHSYWTFEKHAIKQGFAYEEARLYFDLRDSIALRGDIYVMISDIEIGLHDLVRNVLTHEYGPGENEWWKTGVPLVVRKQCVQAREEDPDPVADAYSYTNFIHLSDIVDVNWRLFESIFKVEAIRNKNALKQMLRELNYLRNAVMHPVKRKPWRSSDLEALKVMHDLLCGISAGNSD